MAAPSNQNPSIISSTIGDEVALSGGPLKSPDVPQIGI